MRRHAWSLAALGLLCMLFHAVARVVRGGWDGWPAWVGGAGLALWLLWIWLDWDPLRRAAASRSVRFEAVAGLLVLLSVALAVGLDVLAARQDRRWDLTAGGRHSVAPQTAQILADLTEPVTVLAFFQEATPDEQSFSDLLDACAQHTDRLQVERLDPYRDAAAARQHGITSDYGTVVLLQGERRQRLESAFDEEALANALLRLTSGVEHSLCALTDHAEADPDDDEPGGWSGAVMKLEGQGYRVEKLSIVARGGVPETCEAVLAVGPKVDLLPEEREAMAAYLAGGGSALYLLEPLNAPATAADLRRYGLELREDVVLQDSEEMRQLGFDPSQLRLLPDQLGMHPITEKLDSVLYLQLARTVTPQQAPPAGLEATALLRTTPDAWAETDLAGGGTLEPTEGVDLTGSVSLAAAVEIRDAAAVGARGHDLAPAGTPPGPVEQPAAPVEDAAAAPVAPGPAPTPIPGGRLAVFGDAGFATNQHLLEGLNQDLLLNAVAWLVGEQDQISIRPNDQGRGLLDYDLLQALVMWFVCLFGAPGLALAAALFTWLRRRRM